MTAFNIFVASKDSYYHNFNPTVLSLSVINRSMAMQVPSYLSIYAPYKKWKEYFIPLFSSFHSSSFLLSVSVIKKIIPTENLTKYILLAQLNVKLYNSSSEENHLAH